MHHLKFLLFVTTQLVNSINAASFSEQHIGYYQEDYQEEVVEGSINNLQGQQSTTKYLLYEVDHNNAINDGKGYAHQVHAIACAMLEAKVLNRTLLLPDILKLQAQHSFNGWFSKPIAEIFNLTKLQQYVPIEFVHNPNAHVRTLVLTQRMMELVAPVQIRTQNLGPLSAHVDIITRPHIGGPYWSWFDTCHEKPGEQNQMRAIWLEQGSELVEAFRATDSTLALARQIQERIGSACTLHVRRGDKLKTHPGLDEQTRPNVILERIRHKCPPGSTLYLASNEHTPGFFDPLKEHYKLYMNRDFVDILEPAGAIKKEDDGTIAIVDNFLLYQVEVEIMLEGKPFMDTFCVIYHGERQLCERPDIRGTSAGAYGFAENFPNYRAAIGLIGG